MAKRTQKLGATAKYGSRYGVSVRRSRGRTQEEIKTLHALNVITSRLEGSLLEFGL